MKSTNAWLEFTWDLSSRAFPEQIEKDPAPCRLEEVAVEGQLLELLAKSASMDSSLGDAGRILRDYFSKDAKRHWHGLETKTLGVFHGDRMVAASVICVSGGKGPGLLSGPCVLGEYCNRGLGTYLLQRSLGELRATGATSATGICGAHGVLAKYVYPKFGGNGTPCAFPGTQKIALEESAA